MYYYVCLHGPTHCDGPRYLKISDRSGCMQLCRRWLSIAFQLHAAGAWLAAHCLHLLASVRFDFFHMTVATTSLHVSLVAVLHMYRSLAQQHSCVQAFIRSMAYQLPHGVLPAKPQPPGRQARRNLTSQMYMPSSLSPVSSPFPGLFRAAQVSTDSGHAESYAQSSAPSAAPDSAVSALQALGEAQSDTNCSGKDSNLQYQASDVTAQTQHMHKQTDPGSKISLHYSSQQASSKAVPFGHHISDHRSGNENLIPGFGLPTPCYVTPTWTSHLSTIPPLSETTVTTNTKTENAYVSFDEWQAQVRAKQLSMPQNSADAASQQTLAWLPRNLAPGHTD